ncbi:MAG: type transport system ATP-binding protein [Gaiellaceae bacterium]|nr:type transport system ATP-binding protein [Gaiellaceae bacterium]
MSEPLLRAIRVARRYGDVVALEATDFDLVAGETVALIGANGAGKSTLLAILAGAVEPTEGSVETRARLGWVPQRPAQYARLSPRENLELFARLEGVPDPASAAGDLLQRFSLPSGRQPAGVLSVGNRQRLNVALSLLGEPQVLLLDEPTASLDPAQRRLVWDVVNALRGDGGAVCFATQNVEEVEHADRVVALQDGRIVGASVEEVFG